MHTLKILLLLVCFSALTATAQTVPDFSGIWQMDEWAADPWPLEPPFTAKGADGQKAWAAATHLDPTYRCLFHLVRIASAPFPHEVIQQENRVTILYEYQHQVRRVFMDGRGHPEDSFPTLMGHSIGYWEGETLVVDTVGVEAGYLRPQGFPHGEQLHVVEKRTLINEGSKMRWEITITDPEYYREPINAAMNWSRTDEDIFDYDCIVRDHLPAIDQAD